MARTAAKKQQDIPGTEREEIPELTAAAENLRKAEAERKGVTAKIADASAHLDMVVLQLIQKGDLKLPDKVSIDKEPIYHYDDEHGEPRTVRWTKKQKGKVTKFSGGAEVSAGVESEEANEDEDDIG